MRALIDADMPAHELGHIKRDTGETDENGKAIMELVPWEEIEPVAKGKFISILIQSQAGGFKGFLSKGSNTFRHLLATIRPYKGHREGLSRDNVDKVKDLFEETYGCEVCEDWEADDGMAMEQWEDYATLYALSNGDEDYIRKNSNTVICSRDKDLDTVPGWHFNWTLRGKADKAPYYITLLDSWRAFYKQLLTGDAADNIHGLYGVGPKGAWVKQLDEMDNEADMYKHVKEKYYKHYRNHWHTWLMENAKLLWMWRKPNDEWLPPDERDNTWYNW